MATIGNAPVFPTESVLPGNLQVTGNATISGSSATVNGDEVRTLGTSGAIVQVVYSKNPTTITTGTSTSTDITFHSQAITPTSSSNKILALCSCFTERSGGNDLQYLFVSLDRDSTRILTNWGNAMNYKQTNGSRTHASTSILDAPATTNSVTYRVSVNASFSGGTSFFLYSCDITLMEVVG